MADDDTMRIPPVGKNKSKQIQRMLATRLASASFDKFRADNQSRNTGILSIALLLSLGMNFYQATRPPVYQYVYADRSGRVMPLFAMNKPNMSTSDVTTWVSEAVTNTLSFNYSNYRTVLENAEAKYFVPKGWASFQKNMTDSHLLQLITDNNSILTVKPTAAPKLEADGLMDGVYAWSFKIPLQLTMDGTRSDGNGNLRSNSESRNMIANVIVVRQPEISSESGIGITKFFLSEE